MRSWKKKKVGPAFAIRSTLSAARCLKKLGWTPRLARYWKTKRKDPIRTNNLGDFYYLVYSPLSVQYASRRRPLVVAAGPVGSTGPSLLLYRRLSGRQRHQR